MELSVPPLPVENKARPRRRASFDDIVHPPLVGRRSPITPSPAQISPISIDVQPQPRRKNNYLRMFTRSTPRRQLSRMSSAYAPSRASVQPVDKVRRWCCVAAGVLLIFALIMLTIALMTPEWLVARESFLFSSSSSQFTNIPGNPLQPRRDHHTIGIWMECLWTRFLERVCTNTLMSGNNYSTASWWNWSHWRVVVFSLIIAALVCGLQATQLSLCAYHMAALSPLAFFFTLITAILTIVAISIFNDWSLAADTQQTAESRNTFAYGYSYDLAVISCVLMLVACLCYIMATGIWLMGYCQRRALRQQIKEQFSHYDVSTVQRDYS